MEGLVNCHVYTILYLHMDQIGISRKEGGKEGRKEGRKEGN